MNIYDYFTENSKKFPDKYALIHSEKTISYQELEDEVQRVYNLFSTMGIWNLTHIALLLNNSIEFAIILLAASKKGATLVPLSPSLASQSLEKALNASGTTHLIAEHTFFNLQQGKLPVPLDNCLVIGKPLAGLRSFSEQTTNTLSLDHINKNTSEDSDYILTMTSGSTGNPKPIVLSQRTKIERAFEGTRDLYNLSSNDVIIVASPLYHSLGLRLLLLPLLLGGTGIILSRFHPKYWLEAVQKHKISFTIAVSSHLEILLNAPAFHNCDLSSLRCIVSSSSLLRPDVKAQCIKQFSCEFHECYGTSEIGVATNLAPETASKYSGSVGKALNYVDLRIVDNNHKELEPGQKGEIICKTPTAFLRYHNNKKATAESVINNFFYTGDFGYLNQEGYLYLCGRKKELIIVGGTNVYPQDIETVLETHPSVKEAAVIGVEDDYFGEAILAVITTDEQVDIRELKHLCAKKLTDYQQPMAYEIVKKLPKNQLGKLMKYKLKEKFSGYDASKVFRTLIGWGGQK